VRQTSKNEKIPTDKGLREVQIRKQRKIIKKEGLENRALLKFQTYPVHHDHEGDLKSVDVNPSWLFGKGSSRVPRSVVN